LIVRQVAVELFRLIRTTVFDRTDWEGAYFAIDETLYWRGSQLLYGLLYKVKDLARFPSWQARCRAMHQLLNGKFGHDVLFGLDILLLPNWDAGPPTKDQWKLWTYRYLCWLWGWIRLNQNLNLFTFGPTLDDPLWTLLTKASGLAEADAEHGNPDAPIPLTQVNLKKLLRLTDKIVINTVNNQRDTIKNHGKRRNRN
jgi:hypothetical protein